MLFQGEVLLQEVLLVEELQRKELQWVVPQVVNKEDMLQLVVGQRQAAGDNMNHDNNQDKYLGS